MQETCPHRRHTRRQGGFFWVNVLCLHHTAACDRPDGTSVVMTEAEPSAETSGGRTSAPGSGCHAETGLLPPSDWEVWVRR